MSKARDVFAGQITVRRSAVTGVELPLEGQPSAPEPPAPETATLYLNDSTFVADEIQLGGVKATAVYYRRNIFIAWLKAQPNQPPTMQIFPVATTVVRLVNAREVK